MKEINVLFLDDEKNVLNSISRLFEDEPYGFAVADSFADAMAIMARENIKVVLSDQRMPDITGIEFLRQIKEQYPHAIRILFTAYADLSAAEAAINVSQVYRFINKPWNPDELKASVAGAIHYFDIVAENRRLFEETKIKNEELNLANCKLKALYDIQKEFSSTLSHELRTPLSSIKAAIDIVISGTVGEPTPEQKDFLGRAKSNVDRLNRLINDILDLAHMESGHLTLNRSPQTSIRSFNQWPKSRNPWPVPRIVPKNIFGAEYAPASLDQDKIIQVLNNLINNALKFTETGGITVSSLMNTEKHQVEVRVQDTGYGIKEEDLVKLFQKFQQLGESHQRQAGTGLGLAICKEIIRQHEGRVGVESKIGQGSCFYFILPVEQK